MKLTSSAGKKYFVESESLEKTNHDFVGKTHHEVLAEFEKELASSFSFNI